jgi:hypothetical protein
MSVMEHIAAEVILLRDRDGDDLAIVLLHTIGDLATIALRRGGVPCTICRKLVRRDVQQAAFAVAVWPEGDLHRTLFCSRCAEWREDRELHTIARHGLADHLRAEWAAARGSTFTPHAGHA